LQDPGSVTISIIIATRDRARLLENTLDALAAQEVPDCGFETLVVDNGSGDDTRDVVVAAARRMPAPVLYLHEARPGKSHALNTAVARARGEFLVLTDDDVLPSPGWLVAYAQAFAETGADFVVGRILPLWEAPPPSWLSPALYGVLAVPDGGINRLPLAEGLNEEIMPLGANMAVRRHVVERIGGWNTNLGKLQGTLRTGEDHEFALRTLRAGFRGVYEPGAWVRHRVPADRLRLSYFQRWYFYNGAIQADLEDDYPSTQHYLLRVPRYFWRQLAQDLLRIVLAAVTLDARGAMTAELRLAWLAGYVRARWVRGRNRGALPAPTVTIPRS
jgi:glycosyltransferase involved in cell wall biosynthesis